VAVSGSGKTRIDVESLMRINRAIRKLLGKRETNIGDKTNINPFKFEEVKEIQVQKVTPTL
jgi:hypothetical protein